MSSPRLHAIHRFAGMLVRVCAVLIAPSVSAFPIYTAQQEARADSSPSAAPVVANSMELTDVGAGFQTRQSGVSDYWLIDPRGVLATMPTATSASSIIEGYPLTMEGTPLAAPADPDAELESFTIGGMQYSTGHTFDANDCNGRTRVGPCDAIEDAFFDLALAWAPELGRQQWYET